MFREKAAPKLPGLVMAILFIALEILSVWWFVNRIIARDGWMAGGAAILFVICLIGLFGLTPVSRTRRASFSSWATTAARSVMRGCGGSTPSRSRAGT